jgi:hypothetical protein
MSSQLYAPAALPPWERAPNIYWIADRVDPRASLDDMGTFLDCRDSNSDPSVVQPVDSLYIDYATARHTVDMFLPIYLPSAVKFLFIWNLHLFHNYGPPLRSSGQCSWLQIRRPGFDSRHYQKKKVVGLERGPLSLVSTIEELLERKVAAPV